MCTVSAIHFRGGFRLACNRDELIARPTAYPPARRVFGDRRALLPIDPLSDGTWIAVNDAGVAMVLLNANPPRRLGLSDLEGRESRGVIIPSLLHHRDAHHAMDAACAIDPLQFPPFRLIIMSGMTCAQFESNGLQLAMSINAFDRPVMFTSSGLGDHLVEGPRRALFEQMVCDRVATAETQDAFHSHSWLDRPHLSVRMSRDDARTVSQTIIEVRPGVARMTYAAMPAVFSHQLQSA